MRAATSGKRTNPIRVRNLPRLALRHDQIFARHCSPGHIRRTRAFLAINAMTINHRQWATLQHVSCPAAKASTNELHTASYPTPCHVTRANNGSSRRNSAFQKTQPAAELEVTRGYLPIEVPSQYTKGTSRLVRFMYSA